MKTDRRNIHKPDRLESWIWCSLIIAAFLVMIFPSDAHSQLSSKTENTNTLYFVIGNIKKAISISGRSSPPGPAEVSRDEHGIKMTVYPPLFVQHLVFEHCDAYEIVDGMARNIPKDRQVVLLADRFFKASPTDQKVLFFAERYFPPEEFIKENNLKDCFILKLMKEKRYALKEGTRQFDWELKKYGISPPQQDELENGSMPDLPGN